MYDRMCVRLCDSSSCVLIWHAQCCKTGSRVRSAQSAPSQVAVCAQTIHTCVCMGTCLPPRSRHVDRRTIFRKSVRSRRDRNAERVTPHRRAPMMTMPTGHRVGGCALRSHSHDFRESYTTSTCGGSVGRATCGGLSNKSIMELIKIYDCRRTTTNDDDEDIETMRSRRDSAYVHRMPSLWRCSFICTRVIMCLVVVAHRAK